MARPKKRIETPVVETPRLKWKLEGRGIESNFARLWELVDKAKMDGMQVRLGDILINPGLSAEFQSRTTTPLENAKKVLEGIEVLINTQTFIGLSFRRLTITTHQIIASDELVQRKKLVCLKDGVDRKSILITIQVNKYAPIRFNNIKDGLALRLLLSLAKYRGIATEPITLSPTQLT